MNNYKGIQNDRVCAVESPFSGLSLEATLPVISRYASPSLPLYTSLFCNSFGNPLPSNGSRGIYFLMDQVMTGMASIQTGQHMAL